MAIYTTTPPLTRSQIGTSTYPIPPGDNLSNPNQYLRVVEGRTEGPWDPATSNEFGFRWDAVKQYQGGWDPVGFAGASDPMTLWHKSGHLVLTTFSPRGTPQTPTAYADDSPSGTFTTSIDTVGPVDDQLTSIYNRIHTTWPWNAPVNTGMVVPGTNISFPGVRWGGSTPSMIFIELENEPNVSGKNMGTPDEYCKWFIQCVKVYRRYLRDHPTEPQRIYFCTGMAATGSANMGEYLTWHGFNADGTQKAWCLRGWAVPGADIYFPFAPQGNVRIAQEMSIPDEPSRFKPFEQWVEAHFGFNQSFVWPELGFRYVQVMDLSGGTDADVASPLDISSATGDPTWRDVQLNGGTSRKANIAGGQPVNGFIHWLQSSRNVRSDGGPRLAVALFWHHQASTLIYHPTYVRGRGNYAGRGSINGEFRDGHIAIRKMLHTLRSGEPPPPPVTLGPPTNVAATVPTADAPQVTISWTNDPLAVDIHYEIYAGADTTGPRLAQGLVPHPADGSVPTSWGPPPRSGATRTYWLKSVDASGTMETTGATVTVVYPTATDTTPPTVPAGLVVVPTFGGGAASWSASTDIAGPEGPASGVAGYDLALDGATSTPVNGATLITGTSYTLTGLAAGAHTAQVRAVDNAANPSGWSSAVTFTVPTPDTTPPTVPAGLTATPADDGAVFSWQPSTDTQSGVAGYDIAIDGNTSRVFNPARITTTTYTATGLGYNTPHTVQVQAYDVAGNPSGWSTPPVAFVTPPLVTGGDIPLVMITATYKANAATPGVGSVVITPRGWRQVPDLDLILPPDPIVVKIRPADNGKMSVQLLPFDDPRIYADTQDAKGYNIQELIDGQQPRNRVLYPPTSRPVLDLADVLPDGTIVTTTPRIPDAPTNVAASSTVSGQIDITWTPPPGTVDSYRVFLSDGSQYETGTATPAYLIVGLNPGDVFTAAVSAHNALGWSPLSNDSDQVTVAGMAPPPGATYTDTYGSSGY